MPPEPGGDPGCGVIGKVGAVTTRRSRQTAGAIAFLLLFGTALPAAAYIGPGAGFAFVSTFFIFFITFLLAFVTIVTWPLRWFIRAFLLKKRAPMHRKCSATRW